MRRQEIQLMAQARRGDATARCEVGRRYLLGVGGFPRHVALGLEYLEHPSLNGTAAPVRIVAESLPLEQLLELGQTEALARAAAAGSIAAQVKWGAWCTVGGAGLADGLVWLRSAAHSGHDGARRACRALIDAPAEDAALTVLQQLGGPAINGAEVARWTARRALESRDLPRLCSGLRTAAALAGTADESLMTMVAAAVRLAEESRQLLSGMPAVLVRDSLQHRAARGDRDAAFTLGRAVCGMDCDALPPGVFTDQQNMRRGAALLLRAADAGCDGAWLCLYRLHSDRRNSVANPQLARFFLEKAAAQGQLEALRRLGALQLRESASLNETEQAIASLYQAAELGDGLACALLRSLVLPLAWSDEEAALAIAQVRPVDPCLATRLALSRAFGLTKLEALTVDPVDGLRPWGLVVGRNPFISQVRLSAPRAIPANSTPALDTARQAAAFFGQSRVCSDTVEGDLRARSLRQRRLFDRLDLDDTMFFSDASSMTLESLRLGTKWAFRARQPLTQALAA
jgi:TPR repeat protein